MSKDRVRYLAYKLEAINSIDAPTKAHDAQQLGGIVNYYWDMWCKREHTLVSLKQILSTKLKLKCTEEDNNEFMVMKNWR